ncbi:hypothetical protein BDV96DRAFT_631852 [Lophiotrema nucula]|uniref:Uncharacterized protein n=1 Tax=Lophiotrema nucula TaxID=690887 RepID=A0A6A5Z9T0_9PLEO|nr:hypothetical protein BDV96DRAFT_631852 [Lophiotrema nucula]
MVEIISLTVSIVAVTIAAYSTADAYRSRRQFKNLNKTVSSQEFAQKVKDGVAAKRKQEIALLDIVEQYETNELLFPKIDIAKYAPGETAELYIGMEIRLLKWLLGSTDALYPWSSKNLRRAHREISAIKALLKDLGGREKSGAHYVIGYFLWRVVHWEESQNVETPGTDPALRTELEKIKPRGELAQWLCMLGDLVEYKRTGIVSSSAKNATPSATS